MAVFGHIRRLPEQVPWLILLYVRLSTPELVVNLTTDANGDVLEGSAGTEGKKR